MKEFGAILKDLREQMKISQKDFAKHFHVSQVAISRWEKGDREPDFNTLIKLAEFFDVTIDYLLGVGDLKVRRVKYIENADRQFIVNEDRLTHEQLKALKVIVNEFIKD